MGRLFSEQECIIELVLKSVCPVFIRCGLHREHGYWQRDGVMENVALENENKLSSPDAICTSAQAHCSEVVTWLILSIKS